MTIHTYFARKFLWMLIGIGVIFFALLSLVDLMEQLRRFSLDTVSFTAILRLTLLKAPEGLYQILPLIVILASIALFIGLARSSELVVIRASGRSAMITLLSPLTVALLLGFFVGLDLQSHRRGNNGPLSYTGRTLSVRREHGPVDFKRRSLDAARRGKRASGYSCCVRQSRCERLFLMFQSSPMIKRAGYRNASTRSLRSFQRELGFSKTQAHGP